MAFRGPRHEPDHLVKTLRFQIFEPETGEPRVQLRKHLPGQRIKRSANAEESSHFGSNKPGILTAWSQEIASSILQNGGPVKVCGPMYKPHWYRSERQRSQYTDARGKNRKRCQPEWFGRPRHKLSQPCFKISTHLDLSRRGLTRRRFQCSSTDTTPPVELADRIDGRQRHRLSGVVHVRRRRAVRTPRPTSWWLKSPHFLAS
jgi:hypothetical protein